MVGDVREVGQPVITLQYQCIGMTAYRLKWRREHNASPPEDQHNGLRRQDAVEAQLAKVDEIDIDDIKYTPPPRALEADPSSLYNVCELVVETAPSYYMLYDYLTSDEQNEVEASDPDVLNQVKDDE
jgi:hypothetical protein